MGQTPGCDGADKNDGDNFEAEAVACFAANWYDEDEDVFDTLWYQENLHISL